MTTVTAHNRQWSIAAALQHGFTLVFTRPDPSLSPADWDAACAALDEARQDSWPSISGWPRRPDGGLHWVTGSGNTAITIDASGVVEVVTSAGAFTVRGSKVTLTGTPSLTAHLIVAAVAADEGWTLPSDVGAAHLRALADADPDAAGLWTRLAHVVDVAPVALPGSLFTSPWAARAAAVTDHINALPLASKVLARTL